MLDPNNNDGIVKFHACFIVRNNLDINSVIIYTVFVFIGTFSVLVQDFPRHSRVAAFSSMLQSRLRVLPEPHRHQR